jgi:dienelactone hydrolase
MTTIVDSSSTETVRRSDAMYWPQNESYCSQFMKILGSAEEGASTIYECLLTAKCIASDDDDSWYVAWVRLAEANKARGDFAATQRYIETAKSNWLRASNYYRAAEIFLPNDDERRQRVVEKMEKCSRLYLKHLRPRGEIVNISCDGGSVISGYFLRAPNALSKTPVVVCFGGVEVSKDELLHKMSRDALARGLSLLLVDLPGHGVSAWQKQEASQRDIEVPIGRCFDYLLDRTDVDESRIALFGQGFGSTYASRVASLDHRFAAAVCDGGIWNENRKPFMINWISGVKSHVKPRRSPHFQLARKINCPFLVVAGDCDFLEVKDAVSLHSHCKRSGIDMDLLVLSAEQPSWLSEDQISNAARGKEFIFDWIATKLERCGRKPKFQAKDDH